MKNIIYSYNVFCLFFFYPLKKTKNIYSLWDGWFCGQLGHTRTCIMRLPFLAALVLVKRECKFYSGRSNCPKWSQSVTKVENHITKPTIMWDRRHLKDIRYGQTTLQFLMIRNTWGLSWAIFSKVILELFYEWLKFNFTKVENIIIISRYNFYQS